MKGELVWTRRHMASKVKMLFKSVVVQACDMV